MKARLKIIGGEASLKFQCVGVHKRMYQVGFFFFCLPLRKKDGTHAFIHIFASLFQIPACLWWLYWNLPQPLFFCLLSPSMCSPHATWIPHTPPHSTCLKRAWDVLPSVANCVRSGINRPHTSTLQIKWDRFEREQISGAVRDITCQQKITSKRAKASNNQPLDRYSEVFVNIC